MATADGCRVTCSTNHGVMGTGEAETLEMTTRENTIKKLLAGLVTTLVWLMPMLVWAAEGGGGDHHGPPEGWWYQFIGSVVNFAILAFLIVRFGLPKINESLSDRKEAIERDMKEASELKQQAEKRLEDIKERMASLDKEADKILEDYRKIGERERDQIIADAEKQAARIRRDAKLAVESETSRSRRTLESELMTLAMQGAEDTLRDKVDAQKQDELVNRFIDGLLDMPADDVTRASSATS